MQSFAGVSGITGGPWPAFTATDDPTPGVGTNLEASWVGDLFGFFQAIMAQAGVAPNATPESATASQLVDALRLISGTPGEIFGWPGDTLPTGQRALKCSGQTVSLVTYPGLLNVYCGDALNPTATAYYKVDGGGARDIAGTNMVLDDMRGLFLRGRDAGASQDPSGGSRTFGDVQGFAMQSHTHDHLYSGVNEYKQDASAFDVGAEPGISDGPVASDIKTGHVTATATTAVETRPVNTIVTWCIRY
jgi:hypothetical protein